MGLPRAAITKYEAENSREPRTESRGTKNMIHDWRDKCNVDDQVEAFSAVLREAELLELADNLSAGMMMSYVIPCNPDAIIIRNLTFNNII